jgi:diguanylate cyclase (GGDEF)-like protein/PAS domain S-box-containing protein
MRPVSGIRGLHQPDARLPRGVLMARAGAALFAGEGFLALVANAAGGGGGSRTAVVGGVSLTAVGLAALIFHAHGRLTRAHTHAIAALGALLIAVVVVVERPVYGLLYIWLVFFIASFFRPRAIALHMLWILACDGVAVWVSDPFGRPQEPLILLAGTLAGSAVLVFVVRRHLTDLAGRERESRLVLDTVYRSAPIGLALFDRDLRYIRVNDLLASWTSRSPDEHIGRRIGDILPGAGEQVEPLVRRVFETGEPQLGIAETVAGRVFRTSRYPIKDASGRITMVASIIDDVTELTAAHERVAESLTGEREANAFLDALFENAPIDLAFVDADLVFRRVNRRVVESSAKSAEAIIGRPYEEIFPEFAPTSVPAIRRVLETGEPVIGEELKAEWPPGSGLFRHWLINRFQVRDSSGAVLGVTSTRADVTALKDAEARLADLLAREQAARAEAERMRGLLDERNRMLAVQARTDALTGVANRPAFSEQLSSTLERARQDDRTVALLYLDLDGFKAVNDRHGHAVGDRLLGVVAGRLVSAARATDFVARIGGDEFLVLLADLAPARAAVVAGQVAERIHDAVGQPVRLEAVTVEVSASIGIALYPADADDEDALIAAADAAMYAGRSVDPARSERTGGPDERRKGRSRGRLHTVG